MEEVGDLAHSPPALRRGRSRRINQGPQTISDSPTTQKATNQSVINDLEWSAPSSPVSDESKSASETSTAGPFDPSQWQDYGSAFHTAFSLLGGDEGLSLEMANLPPTPSIVVAANSVDPSQPVIHETETLDHAETTGDMENSEPVAPDKEMDDDVVLISSREDDSDEVTLLQMQEQLASKTVQGITTAKGVKGGRGTSKRKGRGRGRKKGKGRARGRGRAVGLHLSAADNSDDGGEDDDDVIPLPEQPLVEDARLKEPEPIEIDISPMHSDTSPTSPGHHSSSDCVCIESDFEHINDSISGQHECCTVEQEMKGVSNEGEHEGQLDAKGHNPDVLCSMCQEKPTNRYTFLSCRNPQGSHLNNVHPLQFYFHLSFFLTSSRFMICCDSCQNWFHGSCVGVEDNEATMMEKIKPQYICTLCITKKQDPLLPKSPCEGGQSNEQQKVFQVRIVFCFLAIRDFP